MADPRRRCENCSHWSSTDEVWGDCGYAMRDSIDHTANATYVHSLGDVRSATLETRRDHGCVAWKSLAAVLRRIDDANRKSLSGAGIKTTEGT